MKWKICKKNQEGQALVTGLAFLIFCGLICLFFLSYAEKALRMQLSTTAARGVMLQEQMKVASLLNQISFNNRNILASLALSANAFTEAADLGIYLAVIKPFSEARSIGDKATFDPEVQGLFNAYGNRVARGLKIAHALTLENKKIVEQIESKIHEIKGDLRVTSPEKTWCLAIESAHQDHPIKIPVLDVLVNNFLTGGDFLYKGCALTRSGKSNSSSHTLIMPFEQAVSSYRNSDADYGVTYVSPENSAAHFIHALIQKSSQRERGGSKVDLLNSGLVQVHKYSSQLLDPQEKNPDSVQTPKLPFAFTTAITHPSIRSLQICKKYHPKYLNITGARTQQRRLCGALLTRSDFNGIKNSDFEPGEFLFAFFSPSWVPFLISQEN